MAPRPLSQIDKSAIVLLAFGKDIAVEIIKNLNNEDAKSILTAIDKIKVIDSETASACIDEFYTALVSGSKAKTLVGDHNATKKILGQELQLDGSDSLGLSELIHNISADNLSKIISLEHPQVIAVILAFCGPKKAGLVAKKLERSIQIEAISRLSKLEDIPHSLLPLIMENLKEANAKMNKIETSPALGGSSKVTAYLKTLDREKAHDALDQIRTKDPNLAAQIDREWHSINQVTALCDEDMQVLIANLKSDLLLISLRGESSEIVEAFTKNMSARAREIFTDDLSSGKKIEKSLVLRAQDELVKKVLDLCDKGKIANPFSNS